MMFDCDRCGRELGTWRKLVNILGGVIFTGGARLG